MSGFAYTDDGNPFEDPAVLEALRSQQQQNPKMEDFSSLLANQQTAQQPSSSVSDADVAIVQPTMEPPPPYTPVATTSWDANAANLAATEDLRRRQEELERKAAELQRREDEIQRNMQFQGLTARRHNFPPLPSACPVQPCFYQDISVEIPVEFQKIVKTIYYLWLAYVGIMLLNVFGALAYFVASIQYGMSNSSSGVVFGLSLFYAFLFTPCSYVCWFRPLYKAFRSDSSFNFFMFFFVFFFQFCVTVIQSLGIDNWGTVGFINSLGMFKYGAGASVAGVMMIIIGVMFAAIAFLDMIMLIKVHRIYRNTGASFAKAQQEFAQDVIGNRTIQRAAGNLAATASRSAVEQTWSGSRY